MPDVVLYGSSDDLVEVEGDVPGCNEYNVDRATFVVTGPAGGVSITVQYGGPTGDGSTWTITVAMLDEDYPMLPVAVTGDGYTCRAVVSGADRVSGPTAPMVHRPPTNAPGAST